MSTYSNKIVPENTKGKLNDVDHSVTFDTRQEATEAFEEAHKRMLAVNAWHKLSGFVSAEFSLKNRNGKSCARPAQIGDYIRIDIPGPGPASGDGYDWVHVEAIEDKTNPRGEEESFGMRIRSSKKPNKKGDDTAHFFTSDSTSTFLIERKQNTVTTSYHGRNEVLNTGTKKLKDRIRNTIVGTGALIGISELQWARLIKSFLQKEH